MRDLTWYTQTDLAPQAVKFPHSWHSCCQSSASLRPEVAALLLSANRAGGTGSIGLHGQARAPDDDQQRPVCAPTELLGTGVLQLGVGVDLPTRRHSGVAGSQGRCSARVASHVSTVSTTSRRDEKGCAGLHATLSRAAQSKRPARSSQLARYPGCSVSTHIIQTG
jgi:hypothetical protein